jgi:hypothetical protein
MVPSRFSPEEMADIQAALERAAKGLRPDPEKARKAREEMEHIREEIFREHGILDIGVPAIRALRDGEDEEDE